MTKFKEAQEQYPELMKTCHEINFNAAYDWAEMMLRRGKKKAHSHYLKDFLHRDLKVYTMQDHFSAILLLQGYKRKDDFFYIDKDLYEVITWWDMLARIESNADWYYDMNAYARRRVNIVAYRNYIEYKKLQEKYTELESYKLYKEEYSTYF